MSKKIGFGIIGCGGIARDAHLPSLKEIPDAKIIAISRRTEKEAKRKLKFEVIGKLGHPRHAIVFSAESGRDTFFQVQKCRVQH